MDEKKPLISVIVPIYNVKPYLKKCLDSLKRQTMKEIEVIMIDDGSTDGSGEIADAYVNASFPVFHVIHTKNNGLSAARNRGLEEAKSDFIMFVDSDDWVSKKFCDISYRAITVFDADIVIFSKHIANEKGKVKRDKMRFSPTGMISHEDAIDYGGPMCWNKIYKKELFDGIRYPEGHMYEDIAITHKLIYSANSIKNMAVQLYYYRERKNSISHSSAGLDDLLNFSLQKYNDLIGYGYPEEKAKSLLYQSLLRCCGKCKDKNDPVYLTAFKILNQMENIPDNFSKKDRLKIGVLKTNEDLYRFLYKTYLNPVRKGEKL